MQRFSGVLNYELRTGRVRKCTHGYDQAIIQCSEINKPGKHVQPCSLDESVYVWDSPKGYTQRRCRQPPPPSSPGDYNDKHVSRATGSRKRTRCTRAVPRGPRLPNRRLHRKPCTQTCLPGREMDALSPSITGSLNVAFSHPSERNDVDTVA